MKPRQQKQFVFALIMIVVLVTLYYFRPLVHSYVMSIWIDPLGTILKTLAIIALIAAAVLATRVKIREQLRRPARPHDQPHAVRLGFLGAALLLASFVWGFIANDARLAVAAGTFDFPETTSLPAITQDRLVPLAVAERFGKDALQRPTEHAFVWHPQMWDGKLSWVAPLTPTGAARTWFDKAAGVQVVNASSTERQSEVIEQKFEFSEGIALRDNIRWQLYKKRYFTDLPEVFYGRADGKVYAIVPILSYKGALIKYPQLDGAFVVDPGGGVQELTVEQAKQHPAVKSAGRLYPESYARFVHESYALRGGLFNKWFRHVDQTEISDPPGENNRQPYMLATTTGLNWLSAADPWGQSFGVYKIFITDAMTGETKLYNAPKDSSLTGATQAIGYVKSAKPQYNWQVEGENSSSGNILALEPRPVFVKNQLYWVVSITTTEAKGVNETCFVNSANNQVTCVAKDEEARSFLAGGSVQPNQPQSAGANPSTSPSSSAAQRERLDKLEQSLKQALQEIEALKAESPKP